MTIPNLASIRSYHARLGFWSAITFVLLLTMLNVAFAIMALRIPASEWQGMEDFASSYQAIAFVPQTIGLFSIPPLLIMLASIHLHADERRKIWSLVGLLFAIAYAGLLGALYFIQVAVILPALKGGHWQGLDQFTFANPRSVAWGLDHFAWSLLGVALFCMAWVFVGDGLQRWIRWSFFLMALPTSCLSLLTRSAVKC